MNLKQTDMTKGNIAHNTALLFGPLLGAFFLNILYDLTDSLWIGNIIGEQALAIQTDCLPVALLFIAACMGAANGVAIVFSRYTGAKDEINGGIASATVFRLTLIAICIVVPLLELCIDILLKLLNTPVEIYPAAKEYLRIHIFSFPSVALYMYISAILRSKGNTILPMIAVLISTILNALLDPLFIYLDGLNGVVMVTVITQTLMVLITAIYCLRRKSPEGTNLFGFSLREILHRKAVVTKDLFKNAIPSIFQQIMPSISTAVITSLIGKFGILPLAAYGTACKLEILLLYPAMAVNMTLTVATGQCYGAGLKSKARAYVRCGMIESGGLLLVLTVIVLLFQRTLSGFFGISDAAKNIVHTYFLIIGTGYLCNGLTNCLLGNLNGSGHPEISMGIMIVYYLLIRIPLATLLSATIGLTGIWDATLISHLGALLISFMVYKFMPIA